MNLVIFFLSSLESAWRYNHCHLCVLASFVLACIAACCTCYNTHVCFCRYQTHVLLISECCRTLYNKKERTKSCANVYVSWSCKHLHQITRMILRKLMEIYNFKSGSDKIFQLSPVKHRALSCRGRTHQHTHISLNTVCNTIKSDL